jgi:hypothetical protein
MGLGCAPRLARSYGPCRLNDQTRAVQETRARAVEPVDGFQYVTSNSASVSACGDGGAGENPWPEWIDGRFLRIWSKSMKSLPILRCLSDLTVC